MSSSHDREHLDDLLDQSAPPTPTMTNTVTDEVTRLHVLTRQAAERTSRRKRWSRPTIAGAIALLLVGGATTAVATGWRPDNWKAGPVDSSYELSFPSGTQCTMFVGNVQGSDPESVEAVRSFYRDADYATMLSDAAVDKQIQQDRRSGEEIWALDADQNLVPGGYGTDYYDADQEYQSAVSRILNKGVAAKLEDAGLTGVDPNLMYDGYSPDCFGPTP